MAAASTASYTSMIEASRTCERLFARCEVASRAARILNGRAKAMRGSKALVLGVAYKAGHRNDYREAPGTCGVIERLVARGAEGLYYDLLGACVQHKEEVKGILFPGPVGRGDSPRPLLFWSQLRAH